MKKLITPLALCAFLSGCVPATAGDPPVVVAPIETAAPVPPSLSYPVIVNGPDGVPLITVYADGSFQGDPDKVTTLLSQQRGNSPQESVLLALVVRALRDSAAAKPSK